jgi:protein gp37
MGQFTGIQWTDRTFNPWRGCTKISPGCKNCYMFTEQERYGQDPSVVTLTKTWRDPMKWQKEAEAAGRFDRVFTCSWSDWFHEDADIWRPMAWNLVRSCPNLIFQILTKRPERIVDHLPPDWGAGYPNVWMGVSVENNKHGLPRIAHLVHVDAPIRFLSVEPLLERMDLIPLVGIHWVIIGGESGPGARPCQIEWIADVLDQARAAGVAPFVKQLGSNPTWNHIVPGCSVREKIEPLKLKDRKGGDMSEWPEELRVREFP